MSLSVPTGKVEWKPRDIAAGVAGVAGTVIDWGARGPFALLSFAGPALKKYLVSQDSSKTQKFLAGVAAFLVGGVTGVVGYLAAAPRARAEAEVQASRRSSVERRFGEEPKLSVQTYSPGQKIDKPATPAPRRESSTTAGPMPERILATSRPEAVSATPAGGAGKAAVATFIRTFQDLAANAKAWTISDKDGEEFAKWKGDTVRIVKAETDALKALIDKTFTDLPASEAKAFHDGVTEFLNGLAGSRYEKEKKFPDILRHLKAGYEKVG
jgi:hypothetical protein